MNIINLEKIIYYSLSYLLILFCLFPYISIKYLNMGSDLQVNAFVFSLIIIILNYKKKIPKIFYYFLPPVICVFILFILNFSFKYGNFKFELFRPFYEIDDYHPTLNIKNFTFFYNDIKFLYTYISFPIIFLATYFCLTGEHKINVKKIFILSIFTWVLVGAVQFLYDPTFLTSIISRTTENNIIGRGSGSLSPEASIYGLMCIFFLFITVEKKKYLISLILILQIIFVSLSFTAIAMLCLLGATYIFIIISNMKRYIFLFLAILFFLNISNLTDFALKVIPAQTRVSSVMNTFKIQILINKNYDIKQFDISVQGRIRSIYVPIKKFFVNKGMPNGLYDVYYERDFWIDLNNTREAGLQDFTQTREVTPTIMSAHGRAMYELGIFFLFYVYISYLIFNKYSKGDFNKTLSLFVPFNLFLLLPVSYANPMVAFILAYYYTSKNDSN